MHIRIICVLSAFLAFFSFSCSSREELVNKRINQGVQAIRMIDSHEHLVPEAERNEMKLSLFTNLHYVLTDMWIDGLNRESANPYWLRDSIYYNPSIPLEKKWEAIAPYWPNVRNTVYSQNLLRAFRDLYGVSDISEGTYRELSEKIQAANRPGWYDEVLKKRAGIDMAICDLLLKGKDLDPSLFRAVMCWDYSFLRPSSLEKTWGVKVNNLTEWDEALDKAFVQIKEWGFVGIKCRIAYERTLQIDLVERSTAEALFDRLMQKRNNSGSLNWNEKKALQDYLLGQIAQGCARHDLPFQIHTGGLYSVPWSNVDYADPTLLIPFIKQHRDTRFVLMHCGYPYGEELLAMAKILPNVVLDMCFIYIVSPSFAAYFLNQAIEMIPRDKILGFGGDYGIPEGAYGHALLCRKVVSKVLADKVLDGYWSEEDALKYARAILRDNTIRVFKLKL